MTRAAIPYARGTDDDALKETCWPVPRGYWDDTVWRLVYGEPTRQDLILARDVMSAYESLLIASQKSRSSIVAALQRVMKKARDDAKEFAAPADGK